MERGIQIRRIWSDDDVVELGVEVSDGKSRFVNQVYVGHRDFADTILGLESFKTHVHGGIWNIRFGEFGCEYANGAFHARLHFLTPRRLYITCELESEFAEFGKKTVASRATLYLSSEPSLLDRFIAELQNFRTAGEAHLEAVL